MIIDDQYLIDQGFTRYDKTPYDNDSVECIYQKCYKDDIGKKYFINIKKWKPWTHPYTEAVQPTTYEYGIQLYKKDSHDAINLLFHSTWKLTDVEMYLDAMWNTGLFDYYEEY